MWSICHKLSILTKKLPCSEIISSTLRNYSHYPKQYIKPIYRKEDQENLIQSKEFVKLKHIPIKAARTEETCSVFHDVAIEKFINYLMRHGEKKAARETFKNTVVSIKQIQLEKYHSAETEEEKEKIIVDPIRIFKMAVVNCRPLLKLTEIKRGGSIYQVPVPISDTEATFRAMRWLILAARDKHREVHYWDRLANDLIDASNNRGRTVKQKLDLHKQCEANRAYAHYRWI